MDNNNRKKLRVKDRPEKREITMADVNQMISDMDADAEALKNMKIQTQFNMTAEKFQLLNAVMRLIHKFDAGDR